MMASLITVRRATELSFNCCPFVRLYHVCNGNQPHRMSDYLLTGGKDQFVGENETSSFKLLKGYGLISSLFSGFNILHPWCTRAVNKLTLIIDQEMELIGAKKAMFPYLAPIDLLKKSEKWETINKDVFHLQDRSDRQFYLAPTHEEVICEWLSFKIIPQKTMPLLFYQIGVKFRDEKRPRSGLLRAKEFLMKDLYTFDVCEETAKQTYEKVSQCYDRIFNRLDLPVFKVKADSGSIGGNWSHEYHLLSKSGEDKIFVCNSCRTGLSEEYVNKYCVDTKKCVDCDNLMEEKLSLELGHTFFLGTRYTEQFDCNYELRDKPSTKMPMQMGCFGLGVSRIVGASLEASPSDKLITWPKRIAPFSICLILPKNGSKEEPFVKTFAEDTALYITQKLGFDLIMDDRDRLTIGNKHVQSKKLGFPFTVVAGSKAMNTEPIFELFIGNSNSCLLLNHRQLIEFFTKEMKQWCT